MKIKVKNYGLVKKAEIEFLSGLNIIKGESGSGKSTVLRGIEGAIFNNTGDSYVSNGKQVAEIEIEYNNHTVKRIRDLKKTSKTTYLVDGEKISKVGSSPVDKVLDVFNIKEIKINNGSIRPNFLPQFSVPFLINETPSKIFDYITLTSKATNLRDVETSISDDIKSLQFEKKSKQEAIDTLKCMLSTSQDFLKKEPEFNIIYNKFNEIEKKYFEFDKLNNLIEVITNNLTKTNNLYLKIKSLEDKYNKLSSIDDIKNNINNINILYNIYNSSIQKQNNLLKLNKKINTLENKNRALIKLEDLIHMINKLTMLTSLSNNTSILSKKVNDSSIKLNNYEKLNSVLEFSKTDNKSLSKLKELSSLIEKLNIKNNKVLKLKKEGEINKKKLSEINDKISEFRKNNINIIICSSIDSLCKEFEISKNYVIDVLSKC